MAKNSAEDQEGLEQNLSLASVYKGKKIILIGGTGFVGKVLASMLLKRFPDIGHIYLMVRSRPNLTPLERFFQEQWPSACYNPVREGLNEFEAKIWVDQRLTPIAGDVTLPLGGVTAEVLKELQQEGIDLVLNVAGVVSFTPPLDVGFQVNAQGVLNLIDLCRAINKLKENDDNSKAVPLLHTSTCYVAGRRTGRVFEDDPRKVPFPFFEKIGGEFWDPERELKEGLELSKHIRAWKDDPQKKAQFKEAAEKKLRKGNTPTTGGVLERAIKKEEKKCIEKELTQIGMQRSEYWGWVNTYTYTKSVGEQLLLNSGIPCAIARPAIVESAVAFPCPGWNEGVNTSAPMVYMALQGHLTFPGETGHVIDFIPVDQVCYGMIMAAAELMKGRQKQVYQYGTSAVNPLEMPRLIEMTALYKREFMRNRNRGNPLLNRLYARFEPTAVSVEEYNRRSNPMQLKVVAGVRKGIKKLKGTPIGAVGAQFDSSIAKFERQLQISDMILTAFMPFTAELSYQFKCDRTLELYQKLSKEEQQLFPFTPADIEWRSYWWDIHIKGLRKWVFPHLEAKLKKKPRAEERFSDLVSFLDEICEREGSRIALQKLERDGDRTTIEVLSYANLKLSAEHCAAMLADNGVHPGDNVALMAANSPQWAVAFFGILISGATAVLLDPKLDADAVSSRLKGLDLKRMIIGDLDVAQGITAPNIDIPRLPLEAMTKIPARDVLINIPEVLLAPSDTAAIVFTSGTTGGPKAVALTHLNLTTVLASISPLFKLRRKDSGLSVMPLHHAFELTCGLLLPLLRGARVSYIDEVRTEEITAAFQQAGITAMIGVPKVWEDLEQWLVDELKDSGPFAEVAFEAGMFVNRHLGKALGMNLGRIIFRPMHDKLGGKIRFLLSTGGEIPEKTAEMFDLLGIQLQQSYGLTESSSVMTLGPAGKGGLPLPGVEVEIQNIGEDGIGQIMTKASDFIGDYALEQEADQNLMAADGWMQTGDLGSKDSKGRINVVARENEVIYTKSGKRVYPRDLEAALIAVKGVKEVCVVGVPAGEQGMRVAVLLVTSTDFMEHIRKEIRPVIRSFERYMWPEIIEVTSKDLPRTDDLKIIRSQVVAEIIALGFENREKSEQNQVIIQSKAKKASKKDGREKILTSHVIRERVSAPGFDKDAKKSSKAQKRILEVKDFKIKKESNLAATQNNDAVNFAGISFVPPAIPKGFFKNPNLPKMPSFLKSSIKKALTRGQNKFYGKAMNVDIQGKRNIPYNRPCIIVANHASHLDMGLVKYALGDYGKSMVTLAAKDYFFKGDWRRFYFENFTNLKPFDRGASPRETLREASELLSQGHAVLIFPEGTRTTSGEMSSFRGAVSYLAFKHGVDILPIYLGGTYRSMPRGSYVPKNRNLEVRIGAAIDIEAIAEKSADLGLRTSAMSSKIADMLLMAVESLRDSHNFDQNKVFKQVFLGEKEEQQDKTTALQQLFIDLPSRFCRDEYKDNIDYYFSIGSGDVGKWSVHIRKDLCIVENSKPENRADCVLKTDEKTFTRMLTENYIPEMSAFIDGTVKTNDPELLMQFVKIFNL